MSTYQTAYSITDEDVLHAMARNGADYNHVLQWAENELERARTRSAEVSVEP